MALDDRVGDRTAKQGWRVEPEVRYRQHVWPVNDLVGHDLIGQNCVCGPTLEPRNATADDSVWLVMHRPLDGREEPG